METLGQLFLDAGEPQPFELGEFSVVFRQFGGEIRHVFFGDGVGDDHIMAHCLQRVPDQLVELTVGVDAVDLLEAADRFFNIFAGVAVDHAR